jgi:hypothetical protein
MTSLSQGPVPYAPERPHWSTFLRIPEMWASLAISTMWLAVLFDAIFGPDLVSTNADGSTTTIPSAMAVALFACIASGSVARRGFRRDRARDD